MELTVSPTHAPPTLPEYLKNVSDLKPILGSPSDDEVQAIHAVLRMAHSVAHVPEIFDPGLLMGLTQHLFEVQMARYREKYPCGIFPQDIVHTPPTLPSNISITLKPVHGVPSDEELQKAQAAIRAYGQLTIVPSMFDPKVEMELAQHLFNIQLARYMHTAPKGKLGPKSKPHSKKKKVPESSRSRSPVDCARDVSGEEDSIPPKDPAEPTISDQPRAQAESIRGESNLGIGPNSSEQSLEKLVNTLEKIRKVLISNHQSSVRGTSGMFRQEMMNSEGILPSAWGLQRIMSGSQPYRSLTDGQLALLLQFYGIGRSLVEAGDPLRIREGQRRKVESTLAVFIG